MESMPLNVAGIVIGVFMHFAKRRWRGQTTADVANYFKTHFVDTLIVIASAIAGFILAWQTGTLNFISALGIGYAADSAFNKAVGDTDKPSADEPV